MWPKDDLFERASNPNLTLQVIYLSGLRVTQTLAPLDFPHQMFLDSWVSNLLLDSIHYMTRTTRMS